MEIEAEDVELDGTLLCNNSCMIAKYSSSVLAAPSLDWANDFWAKKDDCSWLGPKNPCWRSQFWIAGGLMLPGDVNWAHHFILYLLMMLVKGPTC